MAHGKVIGTIKLLKSEENGISAIDEQIADGVANLLSVQLQLAEVDKQTAMRAKAEQRALQAQINPHFLFNTLNIIMSFCRTDPNLARTLLSNLAALLQRNFASRADFVTLAEELAGIRAYLELVRYRFGSRLEVKINTEQAVLTTLVPVLSIQPLVENAVQHGLFPKVSGGVLTIEAQRAGDTVEIIVSDNGVGIAADKLREIIEAHSDGIGLQNVNRRLTSIYGDDYGLQIASEVGVGTKITMRIPRNEVVSVCSIG
jgi:two-component system sensor histidine kinase LytS